MKVLFCTIFTLLIAGCTTAPDYDPEPDANSRILNVIDEYDVGTLGIGVIREGKIVWTAYYGEQSPGFPAGSDTMFNTASVNKAITAETALRLHDKGVIDLDEPISEFYIHPDLSGDDRHKQLTPRILLSHQAGFLNWPFEYEDGKLAFIDDPASGSYHYSGIGFRIFAKFLEAKLGKPFPQIVEEEIFRPLDMQNATNSHDKASKLENVVIPVDDSGAFRSDYEFEQDYWSAADDLFVSVEDYANFLISSFESDALSQRTRDERISVITDMSTNPIWECGPEAVDPCPEPYGHSIGWFVFGHEGTLTLHHGGNDRSEGAIGYYQPETGDGGVIFVNSTKGVMVWPKIVDIVDPEQDFQDVFHDVIRKYLSEG